MKSFFKKLSLVLAAAMVISLVPATNAKAADEKPLSIAKQSEKTAASSVEVGVGKTVDLKFFGATDWKQLGWKWASADESIATVNEAGLVLGKAAGFTTVSISIPTYKTATIGVFVNGDGAKTIALGESLTTVASLFNLEAGKSIDLNFYGATGYKTGDTVVWSSSNPAVAKVDKKGVVTAVAAGTTTINCGVATAAGSYKGTAVVAVNAIKGFTVQQTGANTMDITFPTAAQATTNVDLECVMKLSTGAMFNQVWVVDEANTKIEGNVLKLVTYVPFNKATYNITIGDTTVAYEAGIGDPATVLLSYVNPISDDDLTETGREENKAKLVIKDAKGIVLNRADYDVRFVLVEGDDAYVDEETGSINLYNSKTSAKVKAVVSWYVDDEEVSVESKVITVKAESPIPFAFSAFSEKYGIYRDTTAAPGVILNSKSAIDKIWGNNEVKINENASYYVAAILADKEGTEWSLSDYFYDNSIDEDGNYKAYPDLALCDGNGGSTYTVKYKVTDNTKIFIDNNGKIVGVTPTNGKPVFVLVSVEETNPSYSEAKDLGIVAAIPVYVSDMRAAATVTLDKTSATLLTTGEFTTVTVNATVKDQYGEEIADYTKEGIKSVEAKHNKQTFEAAISADKKSFTIDAANYQGLNIGSLSFTVTTLTGKTAKFSVSLKKASSTVATGYKLNISNNGIIKFHEKNSLVVDVKDVAIKATGTVSGCSYSQEEFLLNKPAADAVEAGKLYLAIVGPDGKTLNLVGNATNSSYTVNLITNDTADEKIETIKTGTYTAYLYKGEYKSNNSTEVILKQKASETFKVENALNLTAKATVKTDKLTKDMAFDGEPITKDDVDIEINGVTWDGTNMTIGGYKMNQELGSAKKIYVGTAIVRFVAEGHNGYFETEATINKPFDTKAMKATYKFTDFTACANLQVAYGGTEKAITIDRNTGEVEFNASIWLDQSINTKYGSGAWAAGQGQINDAAVFEAIGQSHPEYYSIHGTNGNVWPAAGRWFTELITDEAQDCLSKGYVFFKDINFDEGIHQMRVMKKTQSNFCFTAYVYADGTEDGDVSNATLLGKFMDPRGGGIATEYDEFIVPLEGRIEGVHNLTFIIVYGSPYTGRFKTFTLE